jgi:hypothetical protein
VAILYTEIAISRCVVEPVCARFGEYSRFPGAPEAQSLGVVLPLIRADRPKFPHLVYEIPNYRIQE